jgi:hypothetical protein
MYHSRFALAIFFYFKYAYFITCRSSQEEMRSDLPLPQAFGFACSLSREPRPRNSHCFTRFASANINIIVGWFFKSWPRAQIRGGTHVAKPVVSN